MSGSGRGDLMSGPDSGLFVSGWGAGVLSFRVSPWLSPSAFLSARRILEGLGLRRLMRDWPIPIASATIEPSEPSGAVANYGDGAGRRQSGLNRRWRNRLH